MGLDQIKKEFQELIADPPVPCIVSLVKDNFLQWNVNIMGPPDSPYQGGKFNVLVKFSTNYPMQQPGIFITTPIYHPNLTANGTCLGVSRYLWHAKITMSSLILSIYSLLCDPDPEDPEVPHIASTYKEDRDEFNKLAREWTLKFATK